MPNPAEDGSRVMQSYVVAGDDGGGVEHRATRPTRYSTSNCHDHGFVKGKPSHNKRVTPLRENQGRPRHRLLGMAFPLDCFLYGRQRRLCPRARDRLQENADGERGHI